MIQQRPSFGFLVGVILALCFFLLALYFSAASRVGSYYLGIVGSVLALAMLPFVFQRLKKEAVPAKRSDFIGYSVILAFCILIYFVVRAIIT